MSILQPPILSASVVKTEPPTVIKNEPPEPEIMNIDIDEDIKNIDIVSHPLSEVLIKSETVPENIFESKHSEYVEAQAFVKAENISLVQIENIIKCEKTENTDDGNGTWDTGQDAVEVQGIRIKHPKKTDYARCHKTIESNLWKKEKEKIKVIKAPVIQFRCDHCDYKTQKRGQLKKHNIIHLAPEESQYFYCDHCSFKSKYKSSVQGHIFTLHNNNVERFRCDHCDYKTQNRAYLKKHNIIHLKPEESQYFYCDHCSFKSRYKSNLKNHNIGHHNENVESFRCDHCDYKSQRRDLLKKHNIKHLKPEESQYFYCDHCSHKSRHKNNLKRHIFGVHKKNLEIKQKRFSCDHCHYKAQTRGRLKNHNLIHLKPEDIQYLYCSHCSFKTKHKYSLSNHQASRHGKNVEIKQKQKRFRCDHCDYKSYFRANLQKHNIIHLNPEEVQYFYCSHCSFKSKRKSTLKAHILRHFQNEEVKFCCYICDFMTLERELIIYHIRTHSKKHNIIHLKPEEGQYFYCDHCSFKSRHQKNLKKHIFGLHNKNEERFRCDHCDFKTRYPTSLRMHKLIHLNPEEVQYFYCSHCSFKSKRKCNLRDHILRHFQNKEVKFCCYICDFMTLERELIIYHIRKHSEVRNKSKIDEGN